LYNQINLDIYVVISREMLIWDDTDMLIYNMITQFNMKFKKKGGGDDHPRLYYARRTVGGRTSFGRYLSF
jgi:hypothetical protein